MVLCYFPRWWDLMWQRLHKISLFHNVCLQMVGSWANHQLLILVLFEKFEKCFQHALLVSNIVQQCIYMLVMIDISSIMITFLDLSLSMTLWGSIRTNKYPHVGMPNLVCIVVVVELKQCATTSIVVDRNMFLSCIWKCCVLYFMKNVLPLLGVPMKICKPCGFPIMESNTHCCSSLNVIMEVCGWNMCWYGFGIGCIWWSCWIWIFFWLFNFDVTCCGLKYV